MRLFFARTSLSWLASPKGRYSTSFTHVRRTCWWILVATLAFNPLANLQLWAVVGSHHGYNPHAKANYFAPLRGARSFSTPIFLLFLTPFSKVHRVSTTG